MSIIQHIQTSFAAGELSPQLQSRYDFAKYANGLKRCENFICMPSGGIRNRQGLEAIDGDTLNPTQPVRIIRYQYSSAIGIAILLGNGYCRFIRNGRYIRNAANQIVQLAIPYKTAELFEIKYTQNTKTIIIVHHSHRPAMINTNDLVNWTFSYIEFAVSVASPSIITDKEGDHNVVCTAIYRGKEGLQSNIVSAARGFLEKTWSDGTVDPAIPSSVITATEIDGVDGYNFYIQLNKTGAYYLAETSSSNTWTLPKNEEVLSLNRGRTPQIGDPNIFNSAGNYPSCVSFWKQRLWFAASDLNPRMIWASRVGDYFNFNRCVPYVDDDRIMEELTSSEANPIIGMVDLSTLFVFTTGDEWVVKNDVISPTTMDITGQTSYGSSKVSPIKSGGNILFITKAGKNCRDLSYSQEKQAYAGNDITVLASHFFKDNPIVDWGMSRGEIDLIWAVLQDGTTGVFTYMPEQQVYAWSRMTTPNGKMTSVACVENQSDDDYIYFTVQRDGRYYVEFLSPRRDDFMEEFIYLDHALWYYDATTKHTVFQNATFYAGKKTTVFADGNVYENVQVDANGEFSLPVACNYVVIGIPYTSTAETLELFDGSGSRSTVSTYRNTTAIIVNLLNSRSLQVGQEYDTLTDYNFNLEHRDDWSVPPQLFTGRIELALEAARSGNGGKVIMQNKYPVPLTINSLIAKMNVGDG